VRDDELLVVSHEDGIVDVWNTHDHSLVTSYRPAAGRFDAIERLPGGEGMVVVDVNGSVSVVDVLSGEAILTVQGGAIPMTSLVVSPDGSLAAAPISRGAIGVWSTESGRRLATAAGHTGTITGLAISADGGQLISSSDDGTVRAWQLTLG
jgi:WD40 repeat protein